MNLKTNILKLFRQLFQNKVQSVLNILGLAIGIASVIIIAFYVYEEYSYDTFNKNFDDIYIVNSHAQLGGQVYDWHYTPDPMGEYLKKELPEIKYCTRVEFQGNEIAFKYKDNFFYEAKYAKVDTDFFRIFTYPLIKGNPETCLNIPGSIVINEKIAAKYFGEEDPVGKTIYHNGVNPMKVTAIMKDFPNNSHLQIDMLSLTVPVDNPRWGSYSMITYFVSHEGTDIANLNEKIKWFNRDHQASQGNVPSSIQPLKEVHLDNTYTGSPTIKIGTTKILLILIIIAIFIFVLACINYINNSTARYEKRSKEIGIKKTFGSSRLQLVKQFLCENAFFIFIGLFIAIVFVHVLLPTINNTLNSSININYSGYLIWIIIASVFVLTVSLAGFYPSLFLSSLKPIRIMKGNTEQKHSSLSLRNLLIILQFTISICLITSTLLVFQQFNFIRKKNLGFHKENVIMCNINMGSRNKYDVIKQEILKNSHIINVTCSRNGFGSFYSSNGHNWEGKELDNNVLLDLVSVDYDYFETMGIECMEGRLFSQDYGTDNQSFVISEQAVKSMNIENPVDKSMRFVDMRGPIIGVLSDAHYRSLHNKLNPVVYYPILDRHFEQQYNTIYLRIKPESFKDVESLLKDIWKKYSISIPLSINFLDEKINGYYKNDRQVYGLIKVATFISIFLSCIGLFGLVLYVNERKLKEIGIRKVNGANWKIIYGMLIQYFVKSIIVALVIANLITYLFMERILQLYEYHSDINWHAFVLGGLITVFITLMVITWQSYRSAVMNPVKALRNE